MMPWAMDPLGGGARGEFTSFSVKPSVSCVRRRSMKIHIFMVFSFILFHVVPAQSSCEFESSKKTFRHGLSNGTRVRCNLCPPGHRMLKKCTGSTPETQTICEECPSGYYLPSPNRCISCRSCESCPHYYGLMTIQNCNSTTASICACRPGYRPQKYSPDGKLEKCELRRCPKGTFRGDGGRCQKHKVCAAGEEAVKRGTRHNDTECRRCPKGTFNKKASAKAKCKPHRTCVGKIRRPGSRKRNVLCEDTEVHGNSTSNATTEDYPEPTEWITSHSPVEDTTLLPLTDLLSTNESDLEPITGHISSPSAITAEDFKYIVNSSNPEDTTDILTSIETDHIDTSPSSTDQQESIQTGLSSTSAPDTSPSSIDQQESIQTGLSSTSAPDFSQTTRRVTNLKITKELVPVTGISVTAVTLVSLAVFLAFVMCVVYHNLKKNYNVPHYEIANSSSQVEDMEQTLEISMEDDSSNQLEVNSIQNNSIGTGVVEIEAVLQDDGSIHHRVNSNQSLLGGEDQQQVNTSELSTDVPSDHHHSSLSSDQGPTAFDTEALVHCEDSILHSSQSGLGSSAQSDNNLHVLHNDGSTHHRGDSNQSLPGDEDQQQVNTSQLSKDVPNDHHHSSLSTSQGPTAFDTEALVHREDSILHSSQSGLGSSNSQLSTDVPNEHHHSSLSKAQGPTANDTEALVHHEDSTLNSSQSGLCSSAQSVIHLQVLHDGGSINSNQSLPGDEDQQQVIPSESSTDVSNDHRRSSLSTGQGPTAIDNEALEHHEDSILHSNQSGFDKKVESSSGQSDNQESSSPSLSPREDSSSTPSDEVSVECNNRKRWYKPRRANKRRKKKENGYKKCTHPTSETQGDGHRSLLVVSGAAASERGSSESGIDSDMSQDMWGQHHNIAANADDANIDHNLQDDYSGTFQSNQTARPSCTDDIKTDAAARTVGPNVHHDQALSTGNLHDGIKYAEREIDDDQPNSNNEQQWTEACNGATGGSIPPASPRLPVWQLTDSRQFEDTVAVMIARRINPMTYQSFIRHLHGHPQVSDTVSTEDMQVTNREQIELTVQNELVHWWRNYPERDIELVLQALKNSGNEELMESIKEKFCKLV